MSVTFVQSLETSVTSAGKILGIGDVLIDGHVTPLAPAQSGGADHDRPCPPAIAGRPELRFASRLAALGGWRSNRASVDPRVCPQRRARVSRVSMAGAVLRSGRDADWSLS